MGRGGEGREGEGRGGKGIELACNMPDIQLARFSMSTLGLVLIGPEKQKKKLFILRTCVLIQML